jgi:hypothetical protein
MGTFDYTYAERQRTSTAEHYQKFYIETPIEDLEVTVSDEATEVVTLTGQVVDPAGDPIGETVVLRMIMFTDEDFDTLDAAIANIDVAATTGMILKEMAADIDFLIKTDATGKFVLTWTDTADQDASTFPGFILPNGKFVEGPEIAFADDTP